MNTIIKHLSVAEFDAFKGLLSQIKEFDVTEEYGLTITMGDKNIIILCDHPILSKEEKRIILWHEKGHSHGIEDEEGADRYALKHLSKTEQEILIDQWEYRHGHEYKK